MGGPRPPHIQRDDTDRNRGSTMTSTPTLAGKRALVTGGSRGIGAAIVRRLASQGATEP
jgi:3-oxoacyl-ACP reductase-like protein